MLQIERGSIVADIGAGGGSWSRLLADQVGGEGHVFATEVKPELVEAIFKASRHVRNVSAVLAGEQNMGLPPDCCDAVLLRLVYHAFDDPRSMRECLARAVRPGGRLLIIDFPGGSRGVPAESLTGDLAPLGFEKIEFRDGWQGQQGVYAILFRKAVTQP